MNDFFDDVEDDGLEPAEEPEVDQVVDLLDGPGDGPPLVDLGGVDDGEYDPEADLEAAPAPAEQHTTLSRREVLIQLAKKHASGSDAGKKAKKSKKAKHDKREEQRSSRPKRMRQSEAEPEAGNKRPRASGPELPEDAYEETEEDAGFINDDGVPEDERYEEDFEVFKNAEEAEEVQPGMEEEGEPMGLVDEVLRGRKRKRKATDVQIDAEVHNLIAQMKACAEADLRIIQGNEKKDAEKKPAMAKFQALQHVNDLLRQRQNHEAFVLQGGLECMAKWLGPYPSGALPLLQIRQTLLDLLQLMNLDTSDPYMRDKLMDSGLGKILMFHQNNEHEKTISFKTKCRDLVLAWSAPIFADADAEQKKKRTREREHRQRMGREREKRQEEEERDMLAAEKRRRAREGEDGYRTRAAVPQPSRMDFVINPGSRVDPLDAPMQSGAKGKPGGGKPNSPMPAALAQKLAAKKRGNKDRFDGVSVEGRGLVV